MWPDGHGVPTGPGRASSGSDVAVIDEHLPAVASQPPVIANMNIMRSTGTHIGNKFVTVTQNIHKNDVIQGGCLGFELVSPARSKRLRCSVAVFVCWALVVTCGLAFYFFYFYFAQTRIDIGLNATWYLRRANWQAMPPSSIYEMQFLRLPVKYVTIGHSALDSCTDLRTCILEVRRIQYLHIERLGDIGPNFLVGGDDGLVFEGAGANVVGMTIQTWNSKMVSIMFLGNYSDGKCTPNQAQLDHVAALIEVLVKDGIVDENYILYGYCQMLTYSIPPGYNIMQRLPSFSHWRSDNASTCRRYDF